VLFVSGEVEGDSGEVAELRSSPFCQAVRSSSLESLGSVPARCTGHPLKGVTHVRFWTPPIKNVFHTTFVRSIRLGD
jgi:hypothetical protein